MLIAQRTDYILGCEPFLVYRFSNLKEFEQQETKSDNKKQR